MRGRAIAHGLRSIACGHYPGSNGLLQESLPDLPARFFPRKRATSSAREALAAGFDREPLLIVTVEDQLRALRLDADSWQWRLWQATFRRGERPRWTRRRRFGRISPLCNSKLRMSVTVHPAKRSFSQIILGALGLWIASHERVVSDKCFR
jgi:hypothetical protein